MKRTVFFFFLFLASITAYAQHSMLWAGQLTGSVNAYCMVDPSITSDSRGFTYLTGCFSDSVDFDPGPGVCRLTAFCSNDVFICKFNPQGGLVWARAFGGWWMDAATSVAVDDSGNVYTTGSFNGTVDFDPGPGTFLLGSQGAFRVFVSKLDSMGNLVWAREVQGDSWHNAGMRITVDNNSDVLVTGSFSDTCDFDPGPGTYNMQADGTNTFVLKLTASGTFVWARSIGGAYYDQVHPYSHVVDGQGNILITGYFQNTIDFDPGQGSFTLSAAGDFDAFVCKLNSSGNFIWVHSITGPGTETGRSITVDENGNSYITGHFENSANFDPGISDYSLVTYGSFDAFVCKVTAAGNLMWAFNFGSQNNVAAGKGISCAFNKL